MHVFEVGEKVTKWTGKSTRDGNGFKLWYSGAPKSINGVGIIMTDRLKDFVVHVERHGDRLMLVRLVIHEETINVISAYAPQSGRSEGEKKSFWDSLDELVRSCPDDQRLVLGGDLNGHIGVQSDGYPGVHGGLGFGRRNEEGRMILEFATAHDLVIANSFFRKRKSQLITFQRGRNETQIDYFLVRKETSGLVKIARRATKTEKAVRPRILWKNLMGEAAETFRSTTSARFSLEIQNVEHMDADQLWTHLVKGMRETAKAVLGETRGTSSQRKGGRESWWISEEVQTKVATKLSCFKELIKSKQNGTNEDWSLARQRYYEAKKEAKKIVAIAKERAYEELYKKLDSKEGKNDIFRIAKARERKRMDLGDVIYIKDESGRSIVKVEDIRKRWEEYFANLFNRRESGRSEGGIDHGIHSDICCDDDDTPRISQEEVRLALKKMGRSKQQVQTKFLSRDGDAWEMWG
uniref:uncharacterized protein LOC122610120 n=1 Tax=Erigeron canadensis TaxID=72917 RepID=UPI001CB95007|nr:uncharacterized protein LOC122610120 [Erigeron canadensis]